MQTLAQTENRLVFLKRSFDAWVIAVKLFGVSARNLKADDSADEFADRDGLAAEVLKDVLP